MTTTQTTDEILTNLYGALEAIWAEQRDVSARQHDVEEQISRIRGDELTAEWHRLAAEAERNPSAEATQIAHAAWVQSMAASYLRRGKTPNAEEHCAGEIEDAMAELERSARATG